MGRRRGGGTQRRGGSAWLAAAVVTVAGVASLASEELPRFFWDLQQGYLLWPTLAIGALLQLAAWAGWSWVAWLLGRAQGGTASYRATLAATGLAYWPALVQVAVLWVNLKDPMGVTVAALIKVTASALVAVSVTASLAGLQGFGWRRAAVCGAGWVLIALLVTISYAGQASQYGAAPSLAAVFAWWSALL